MRVMLTTREAPDHWRTFDIPEDIAPKAVTHDGMVFILDPGYNVLDPLADCTARYFWAGFVPEV